MYLNVAALLQGSTKTLIPHFYSNDKKQGMHLSS